MLRSSLSTLKNQLIRMQQLFQTTSIQSNVPCAKAVFRTFSTQNQIELIPQALSNSIVEIPINTNQLKELTHKQVLFVIEELISITTSQAIEKPIDAKTNKYPLNALDGTQLYNAITVCNTHLKAGGTVESGIQQIISSLMIDDKVPSISIAESIAHWLYRNYIEDKQEKLALFFKQTLSVHLKNSHKSLQSVVQSSSDNIIHSFGHDFPYVGRQEPILKVEDCYQEYNNLIRTKTLPLNKQLVKIPFIAAAPGIGKSRLLKQIGTKWSGEYYPLFISFGNVTKLQGNETSLLHIETSLTLRMMYSFFMSIVDKGMAFSKFYKLWIGHFENDLITIAMALEFLNKALLERFGKEYTKFYLAIDEVHQIDNVPNDKITTHPLKAMLSVLGSYMQQPKYILTPLLAGTYYTLIHSNLLESTYTPQFISIKPLLTMDEQIQLLDSLMHFKSAKKDGDDVFFEKLQNWRTNTDFRYCYRRLGGYPRGIEKFLQAYLTNKHSNAFECCTMAANILQQQYMVPAPFRSVVSKYVFTKEAVTRYESVKSDDQTMTATISQLEDKGFVMLEPMDENSAVVHYPPILLEQLLEPGLAVVFKAAFSNSRIDLNHWEDIIHYYIYLLLQLSKNQHYMQSLFQFGLMSSKTASTMFNFINSTISLYESPYQIHNSIPKSVELYKLSVQANSIKLDDLKQTSLVDQVCIIKNESSASAGDILLFGLQTEEQKLVIHLQCKWQDSQSGTISYHTITKLAAKNQKLQFADENVRNITVIICGQCISDLPQKLDDDLVIIHKENFNQFFGVLADALKYSYVQQFVRINELNTTEFQSFYKIGEESAADIVKIRDENGFYTNLEQLQRVLDKTTYNNLLHGNEQIARTILF